MSWYRARPASRCGRASGALSPSAGSLGAAVRIELERSQRDADYRSRRDVVDPFVDAVIANGVYEIAKTLTPGGRGHAVATVGRRTIRTCAPPER